MRANPFRVGFEVSDLYPENAGIYTYSLELLRNLAAMEQSVQLVLLDGLGRRDRDDLRTTGGIDLPSASWLRPTRLRSILVTNHPRMTAMRSRYVLSTPDRFTAKLLYRTAATFPPLVSSVVRPRVLRSLDVCHWSHTLFVPNHHVASVITVHDTIPISRPEFVIEGHPDYEWQRLKLIGRYATRIITDSESSRRDLVALLGGDDERIDVVPLAAAASFQPALDPTLLAAALRRFGLVPGSYILHVGTLEPRRNVVRLIAAFQRALERHPDPSLRLVLIGKRGWLMEPIDDALKSFAAPEQVLQLGRVADRDLIDIMQGAMALACISLYEGFGLPVLEAMACGVPVIAANATSLPEVAGGAALLVDPYDVSDIADALERVVTSDGLRRDLSALGQQQARRFSWARTAEMTIQSYHNAVETHKSGFAR
jgi:glycosyltransferase involved in cell wall biosynthesis